MKKIKSLKMESSKLQLSQEELSKMKGGSNTYTNSLGLPDWANPNDPDKPGGTDGDPPPEIGTRMSYFCTQDT